MPKPSRIQCPQYKAAIHRRIVECTNLTKEGEIDQLEACCLYEALDFESKQRVMRGLAKDLRLSVQEVSQHYRNCFSRVMYTEDFTKYHDEVIKQVTTMFAQQQTKKEIVETIKQQFSERNVFPPSIESFVYETLSKLERNLPIDEKRQHIQRRKRYSNSESSCVGETSPHCESTPQIVDEVLDILAQLNQLE